MEAPVRQESERKKLFRIYLIRDLGIGLSLTRQALEAGAKVLIADLKLTAAAEQLVNSNPNAIFQKCDVTKWKDFDALFATSEKTWGDVPDAYGICAGLFDPVCGTKPPSMRICRNEKANLKRLAILKLLARSGG